MYEYFNGLIKDIHDGYLIIDVMGIGYRLEVPSNILMQIKVGESRIIYCEQIVSENKIYICGFASIDDRKMFNILRTVPKIGPKTALGILGSLTTQEIVTAVINEDKKTLSSAPGIGAKTAERILIDLKGKVNEFNINIENKVPTNNSMISELEDAMMSLGYQRYEIEKAIAKTDLTDLNLEEAIKLLLKNIV